MSFETTDRHVYQLFTRNLYYIPRNQRRYVWTKRNWQEFWDDIMLVVNGNEPNHFIGSMVLYSEKERENGISHYVIIDGQQRIITLTILLASIALWLKCFGAEDEFNGIKQYLLAHDDSDKEHDVVMSENHISLSKILDGIIQTPIERLKIHNIESCVNALTAGSKDRNIVAAFNYFIKEINDAVSKTEKDSLQYLVELRDTIVNKILYVSIIASSEEDAYTVYEILNARGSSLKDYELLKNYIMRGIKPDGYIDQAKTIWNEIENDLGAYIGKFVKHYAIHRYRTSSQDNISDYKCIQMANKGLSTKILLDDLRLKTSYYQRLINPIASGDNANCSQVEYMVYSFLKKKRLEQIRPILLSLIHQKDIGALKDEDYNNAILYIYYFVVCFNIIGQESSNKITNIVYSMAKELEDNYSESLLQDFFAELNRKLPGKENFINSFSLIGWSHHGGFFDDDKHKERVKIVLELLECHKSASKSCGDFTIEHILDDNNNDINSNIGNLIPLEAQLNQQCAGKAFTDKLIIYSQSSFQTARNIASRYADKEFDVTARAKAMAKELYDEVFNLSINLQFEQNKSNAPKSIASEESSSSPTIGDIVEKIREGKTHEAEWQEPQLTLFDLPYNE